LSSNGGWIATPTDLVKFIMRVDKFPQKADILEATTLDTMFSAPAVNPGYAKGWFVPPYNFKVSYSSFSDRPKIAFSSSSSLPYKSFFLTVAEPDY
jgi:hypothetical protein